jgi:DNA-binding protein YbaB
VDGIDGVEALVSGSDEAVVGPRGQLVELEIDPRVYRRPDSQALAAAIVATATRAGADVDAQVQEILAERWCGVSTVRERSCVFRDGD